MSVTRTLERRDPRRLKPHPLNRQIYGDEMVSAGIADSDELVTSIRAVGVQQPIAIDVGGTVLGGHRRLAAALKVGLTEVPVIVHRALTDPLDVAEFLVHDNFQRTKTVEQRAREFEKLQEIETARAAARQASTRLKPGQKAGGAQGPSVAGRTLAQGENRQSGRADDLAAQAVGLGRTTARQASEVVVEIDRATEAGDLERAAHLRQTLNTKGAAPALREVRDGLHGGNGAAGSGKSPVQPAVEQSAKKLTAQERLKMLETALRATSRELGYAKSEISGSGERAERMAKSPRKNNIYKLLLAL